MNRSVKPIAPLTLALLLALAGAAAAATTEQIHNDAGLVKFYRGEYAEAASSFERALMMNPNNAEAHYNLGRCREKQGDLAAAVAKFEDALRVLPSYSAARTARDRARKKLDTRLQKEAASGKRFKVNVSADLAIPLEDFSEAFYAYYGNKIDRARELYRRMERDNPEGWIVPFERGVICYELETYQEAVTHFGLAHARAPENVQVAYCLGLACEKIGDLERAVALYDEAAKKNPAFTRAAARRGALSGSLVRGLHDEARRAFDRRDWKTAAEKATAALSHVAPGGEEEDPLRNLLTLASVRLGDEAQKRRNVRDAFLAKNHSYDDVWENGRVRYADDNVIWTGVVYRIHERAGETVLVVAFTRERGVSSDELIGTGVCKAKFFQVHCGRLLARDPRLDEDSFVEVSGRIRGGESMIDGYRAGCTAPIPGLLAFKITATNARATGTLVMEPLN